jgi:peroxiredoxin Q/BCP
LRQDRAEFEKRNAAVLIVGPDGPKAFRRYWEENDIPFIGLADLRSRVAELYHQEVNLFKFGRMPALFLIDRAGSIQLAHYGSSMSDIPANDCLFQALDEINLKESQSSME